MAPFTLEHFGNPSSSHIYGVSSKSAIKAARLAVRSLIGLDCTNESNEDLIFTSCGTESDNGAISIALHHFSTRPDSGAAVPRVISSSIEHPGVINFLLHLKAEGRINLCILPVDSQGFVSLSDLEGSLTTDTALVTIMHSNNEVGVIQPLKKISKTIQDFNLANKVDILLHSDIAQSLGKCNCMLCTVVHQASVPVTLFSLQAR